MFYLDVLYCATVTIQQLVHTIERYKYGKKKKQKKKTKNKQRDIKTSVVEHEMKLKRSPSHPHGIKGNKRITSPLIKYAFCFYLHTDSLKRSVKDVEDEQSESTAVTRNVFLLPVKSKVDSSSVGFFFTLQPYTNFFVFSFHWYKVCLDTSLKKTKNKTKTSKITLVGQTSEPSLRPKK